MFVREKAPAVCPEEPVTSTCRSLWNCSTAEMSDGGFVLCHFSFFKCNNTTLAFRYGPLLLLLWSSLLFYLLCNSFSRKPLVEDACSPGTGPASVPRGKGEGAGMGCTSVLSLMPLPIFLQSPWFVNCLHLFRQPTCINCKKEFLNR